MIRIIRFAKYHRSMDFTGVDLVSLGGIAREKAKATIPALKDPAVMKKRWSLTSNLRAMNGEIADEVHEFVNATQGTFRLKQVLLRDGRIIELRYE
jgi:hypothetical protein